MTQKQRLVIIGNGMAGARFIEEVVARQGNEYFDIVVFGDEPYGNYNRILLSGVLAGTHDPVLLLAREPHLRGDARTPKSDRATVCRGRRIVGVEALDKRAQRIHPARSVRGSPIPFGTFVPAFTVS